MTNALFWFRCPRNRSLSRERLNIMPKCVPTKTLNSYIPAIVKYQKHKHFGVSGGNAGGFCGGGSGFGAGGSGYGCGCGYGCG